MEAVEKKTRTKKILQRLVGVCVFLVLIQWMVRVSLPGKDFRMGESFWNRMMLLPFILFGGLYGYFISFLVFLALFISDMFMELKDSYIMSVYLTGMFIFSMMGQYRWFRQKRKTLLGTLIGIFILTWIGFFCRDVFASYDFDGIKMQSLGSHFAYAVGNVLVPALLFYLFYNYMPDGVKEIFPIGTAYTKRYISDLLLQNELKKTRVSRKITVIIVGIVMILGIAGSAFSQILLTDILAMRERLAPMMPSAEQMISPGENLSEGERVPAGAVLPTGTESERDQTASSKTASSEVIPTDENDSGEDISETELFGDGFAMDDFMRSRYGNAFIIKLLLMNLCIGVPLAGIANFYIKMRIGAPLGKLSRYLFNFMDVPEADRGSYAAEMEKMRPNTHDEIGDLYYAAEIMAGDVTGYIERLQEEQHLKEDLRVAQAASEAKSSFLSNMSHEIRTPINAVLGMDEMILRESDDTEIRRYATDIKSAGNTLLSLVNDILDFSKIEAGKMDILPVQYQLGSMINDLVNMLSGKAEEKGLELILKIDEKIPSILFGDEIRIKQCATNILTNAVKYTEKGSVTLRMGFEDVDETHIRLQVRVVDTGIGIRKEDLGKLFSPFERIEEIRNRTIEGTGLGMSITKKLLAMMDTKLVVESEYGKGSDFSFEVVQEVIDRRPIGDFVQSYRDAVDSMERYHESFHAPDAKVLIVDDTRINLTVIRSLLKATQLNVDTAESGRETLRKVTQEKYDIIFLDHRMPEMDGIETLQAMQTLEGNKNTDTPCIALTANAVSGAREEYLKAGFIDYLTKPVESGKLEKMLIGYLPAEKVIRPGDERWKDPVGNGKEKEGAADPVSGTEDRSEDPAEKDGADDLPEDQRKLLMQVTGIDRDLAIKNCGGAEVLPEVLRDFYISIEEKADQIETYAADGDYRNYTVLVHALKSSARLIGAMPLSEAAAYLEQCGNDENAEEIREKTPALLSLYRSYLEHLSVMEPEEDEGRPEISEKELTGAWNDLKECIEAYDYDSAEMIMGMLGEYSIPDPYREKQKTLRRLLTAVDREKLLELLGDKETI